MTSLINLIILNTNGRFYTISNFLQLRFTGHFFSKHCHRFLIEKMNELCNSAFRLKKTKQLNYSINFIKSHTQFLRTIIYFNLSIFNSYE